MAWQKEWHAVASPNFARIVFGLAHLLVPFGMYMLYSLGWSWDMVKVVLVGATYEIVGGFGITSGAHRLWSHRTYEATLPFRAFLMILNCVSFQGEIYYWCRDHRVHHKYSDTEADPHNIRRGFWFSHIGWLFLNRSPANLKALKEVPVSDLLEDPVIRFQNEYYGMLVILMRFIIPTFLGWLCTGSVAVGFFFNANFLWVQGLHHTFLVNSATHWLSWGTRPYDANIPPNENPYVIVMALGEGHHNFHHAFPQDYATSELSWNQTFNPSKLVIDIGAMLGMVTKRTRVVRDTKRKKWVTKKITSRELH